VQAQQRTADVASIRRRRLALQVAKTSTTAAVNSIIVEKRQHTGRYMHAIRPAPPAVLRQTAAYPFISARHLRSVTTEQLAVVIDVVDCAPTIVNLRRVVSSSRIIVVVVVIIIVSGC